MLDSPKLLQLLFHAMKEPRADVRQSAFALLGDLASTSLPTLAAVVPEYMPLIGAGLDVRYHNVCNNATWALGEIAVMLHKNGECEVSIPCRYLPREEVDGLLCWGRGSVVHSAKAVFLTNCHLRGRNLLRG